MEIQSPIFLAVMAGFLIIGFVIAKKTLPIRKKIDIWSIGIYTGKTPFGLVQPNNVTNPVLTRKHVTDRKSDFVADPFMVREGPDWYMFFEVMNSVTHKGEIGLAVSSDGFHWNYKQIILTEPFHLSYPYVFKQGNEYYMIPESCQAYSVRLYKATDFPYKWQFVKTLLYGNFKDSSIFRHNGKWWMFTTDAYAVDGKINYALRLYYSNDLTESWSEKPDSPLMNVSPYVARCGGRVVTFNNKIMRYAQDTFINYGNQIRAFEIIKLTVDDYEEREVPMSPFLKGSGFGWNKEGMHNVDPCLCDDGSWTACVDGLTSYAQFSIHGHI